MTTSKPSRARPTCPTSSSTSRPSSTARTTPRLPFSEIRRAEHPRSARARSKGFARRRRIDHGAKDISDDFEPQVPFYSDAARRRYALAQPSKLGGRGEVDGLRAPSAVARGVFWLDAAYSTTCHFAKQLPGFWRPACASAQRSKTAAVVQKSEM